MIIFQVLFFFLVLILIGLILYRSFSLIVILFVVLFFSNYQYKFTRCPNCKHQLFFNLTKKIGFFVFDMETKLKNIFNNKSN